MGFDRRTLVLPPVAAAETETTANFNLRSEYIRPLGFTMVTDVGAEANAVLTLTDADGRVFYIDDGGKDYSGTALYKQLASDDQAAAKGLSVFPYDSVGVAVAAEQLSPMPVVRNPITVNVSSATATDEYVLTLEYEYGCFYAEAFELPTAVANTSTVDVALRSKFAQVLGFRALSVGTDTDSRLEIKDADGKKVYLDAADKDYDTAELDKIIILDPTVTGLTRTVPFNSIGEAAGAGIGRLEPPLARSPLTITATSQGGNDEVVSGVIYYKTG